MAVVAITQTFANEGKGLETQTLTAFPADLSVQFPNDGNVVMLLKNGATPCVVTLKAVADPYGRGGSAGSGDVVFNLAASDQAFIPFMDPAMFNAGSYATVQADVVTTLSYALYRLIKTH